jgi:hypothetical protein
VGIQRVAQLLSDRVVPLFIRLEGRETVVLLPMIPSTTSWSRFVSALAV